MVGDSLTQFFDEATLSFDLNKQKDKYEVKNFALAGSGVTDNAFSNYLNSEQYEAALAYGPDIVTVLFGTNDTRNWEDATRDAIVKEFKENYVSLINSFRNVNPYCVIFVITTPPLMDVQHSGSDDILYNLYYAEYEIANTSDTYVIDLQDDIMDLYVSDSDTFFSLYTDDIIHFSTEGNEFYKNELVNAIQNLSPKESSDELFVLTNQLIDSDSIGFSVVNLSGSSDLILYDAEIWKDSKCAGSVFCSNGMFLFTNLLKNTDYQVVVNYAVSNSDGLVHGSKTFDFKTLNTKNMVFIGDSLTDDRYYSYDDGSGKISSFAYTRWFDDMLTLNKEKEFDYRVYNYGQAGASATNYWMPFSETERCQDSLAVYPDYLFVLLGTNDFWSWSSSNVTYKQSMTDLVSKYKTINPNVKIGIITSPPALDVYGDQTATIRSEINALQKEVAETLGAELYDLSSFMMQYYNSVKTPKWYGVFGDVVHYNIYGYRMFGKYLYYNFVN